MCFEKQSAALGAMPEGTLARTSPQSEPAMTLHTFNKAPTPDRLQLLDPGDAVLLIEDGVYAAQEGQPQLTVPAGVSLHVLTPDLAARGISARIRPEFCSVDHAGFVGLSLAHAKVINWN